MELHWNFQYPTMIRLVPFCARFWTSCWQQHSYVEILQLAMTLKITYARWPFAEVPPFWWFSGITGWIVFLRHINDLVVFNWINTEQKALVFLIQKDFLGCLARSAMVIHWITQQEWCLPVIFSSLVDISIGTFCIGVMFDIK